MLDSELRLARITRISRIIATLCGILTVLLPLGLAVYVLGFGDMLAKHPQAIQMGLTTGTLSSLAKAAALAALLIGSLPAIFMLYNLRKLFQSYARGTFFTVCAANRLKAAAVALLAMVVARPLTGALLSLALSIDLPAGQKQLVLNFGSTEIWIGLAGGMVLVTAWIMGEAAALAEENRSFV